MEMYGKVLSHRGSLGRCTSTSVRSFEAQGSGANIWSHVHDVQRGNVSAFEQVYRTYVSEVRAYLFTLTHDSILAQDLTSETFLRALKSIRSLEDRGRPLRAWLMTIARNIVNDHRRSWSTRHVIPVDVDVLAQACGSVATTEELVVRRELGRRLWRRLETLPPDQCECLVLRYVAGLSVEETAERMCRNKGAVRALQYRAVRKLGRLFAEEGDDSCRAA
ncbi:sigma-70 family RNA polymerase sigma factor [Haloechinothrix salitolerans]